LMSYVGREAQAKRRLKEHCSIVFLDYQTERPAPRIVSSLEVKEFGKSWLKMFLAPPEFLGELVFTHVPRQGYWTIDETRSPVVELIRCFYGGTSLRSGRLYYAKGFYGEGGQWVEKPAAFLAWAKKVFSVARKGLQRDADFMVYLGREAQEMRQRHGLDLIR
jgi:hypothetical protein